MLALNLSRPTVGVASIVIDKKTEYVFAYVGHQFFVNYPKWAPEVISFEPLHEGSIEVGARAKQIRMDQGQEFESIFEIEAFIPCQHLVIKGVTAPYRIDYQFDAANDGERTLLTFTYSLLEMELFMRPFAKLIRIAIEEGAEFTVKNIKNLIESA